MEVVPAHFSGNPDQVLPLFACRRRFHTFRQRKLVREAWANRYMSVNSEHSQGRELAELRGSVV